MRTSLVFGVFFLAAACSVEAQSAPAPDWRSRLGEAIGRAGNALLRERSETWKTHLVTLAALDWSRTSPVWQGRALVNGRVRGTPAGQGVALQRRAAGGWHTIDRDRTRTGGAFAFDFRPRDAGSATVRVRSGAARAHVGRLNVFRRVQASWYGPGLYGGRLGCGGTLTPGTLGVASKTLPCGAKVTLRHGGRTVRVPVVDRGPFSGGREFDLTAATKERIGFSGAGSVLVAD